MKLKSTWLVLVLLLPILLILNACGSSDKPAQEESSTQDGVARGRVGTIPQSSPTGASASGNSNQDDTVASFDILLKDSYFGVKDDNTTSPPVWKITAGQTLLLNVDNQGNEKHNWVIVKPGTKIPVPYSEKDNDNLVLYDPGMVYAKSKTQLTIKAPNPGEYVVICTVSGHYPFMQGRLVVTEN